jgi:hypothetical protein
MKPTIKWDIDYSDKISILFNNEIFFSYNRIIFINYDDYINILRHNNVLICKF